MKFLIISLVFIGSLICADTIEDSNFDISGKIKTYYSTINYSMTDNTKKEEDIYYLSTQINIDYNYEAFHFQATPYLYKYETTSGDEIKNVSMKPYEKSKIFFRSLYMSYTIDEWTLGIGVVPFSNSMPMKFSDDSIQDGVGLNTLNDNVLTAIFGIYTTENSKTIFGAGNMEQHFVDTGDYISDNLREESKVYFLINTLEHDKFTFTNEIMYIEMHYDSKELSDIFLYGVGVSWDDSADSGIVLYDVAGASIYKNNSTVAKEAIFTNVFGDVQTGEYIQSKYQDSFAINNETYYGGSNLLGIRYEMDLLPLETFINVEWFRTFGDWTSGNQGSMYDGKINQMFNIRDNAYYLNFGILTSKNSLLRFTYSYLEFEDFGKIGAPADTIPSEDFLGGNKVVRDSIEAIHVIFTYRF